MKKYLKYPVFLSISLAILALDQATKLMVHTSFYLGEKKIIIPGFFNITYVQNRGGVFGLFSYSNDVIRTVLFLIFPILAFVFIISIVHKLKDHEKYQLLAFASIFGGALGNYIDRVHFGYVIDFLDFYFKDYVWPAFNVGDIAIVIGVVSAMIMIYFSHLEEERKLNKQTG